MYPTTQPRRVILSNNEHESLEASRALKHLAAKERERQKREAALPRHLRVKQRLNR